MLMVYAPAAVLVGCIESMAVSVMLGLVPGAPVEYAIVLMTDELPLIVSLAGAPGQVKLAPHTSVYRTRTELALVLLIVKVSLWLAGE
jgi:hypothetical protein